MQGKTILLWLGIAALVLLAWWGAPVVYDVVTKGRRLTRTELDDNGNIPESPEDLAAMAAEVIGRYVDPGALGLARMVRSEEGSADATTKGYLCWVALNVAAARGVDLVRLLTMSKNASRNGFFGKQLSRWASTSQDCYENDLAVAEKTIEDRDNGFPDPTRGATKFVDKRAFGVQAGTRTYDEVAAEWATEGLRPFTIAGTPSSLVFFRKGAA